LLGSFVVAKEMLCSVDVFVKIIGAVVFHDLLLIVVGPTSSLSMLKKLVQVLFLACVSFVLQHSHHFIQP
jgi:hypothetical protein